MENITFQLQVISKAEAPMDDGSIRYTLIIQSNNQPGITGELSIDVSDPATSALVDTGNTFDAVLTPHVS